MPGKLWQIAGLAVLGRTGTHLVDLLRTIEERIRGVIVQVNERVRSLRHRAVSRELG